jgi:hypothetical protein
MKHVWGFEISKAHGALTNSARQIEYLLHIERNPFGIALFQFL